MLLGRFMMDFAFFPYLIKTAIAEIEKTMAIEVQSTLFERKIPDQPARGRLLRKNYSPVSIAAGEELISLSVQKT